MLKKLQVRMFFNIFYVFLLICTLINSTLVFRGMQNALRVCLETMIPSLYAMMILSELFIESNFCNTLGRFLKIPGKYLFRCSGQVLAVFLFSQTAGYPVGTRMLVLMEERGQLTKKQASLLSGVCFAGGPVFISSLFAEKKEDAAAVFLAGLLSNFVLFIIISRLTNIRCEKNTDKADSAAKTPSELITDSVIQSGKAVLKICAMIIMFGGFMSLCEMPVFGFLTENLYGKALAGFLEISRITTFFPCSYETLPIIGAALSFGGVCVLLQLSAITKGKIHIGYVLLIRIAAAFITWILLFLRCKFLPVRSEEAFASFSAVNSRAYINSPLPSVLLIIMTFMLIFSAESKNQHK